LNSASPTAPRVLVAGCGFTGLAAARRFYALGWSVTGLTHSAESAQRMTSEPFAVAACDINDRAAVRALAPFDVVVDCVSSGRGGPDAYRSVFLEGARNLLETLHPARFIFTSSTSVYAQTGGVTVTEESLATPLRETGQILRATEDLVLANGGIVARLAGIYGPGRWVLFEKFIDGRAVIEDGGDRIVNQIHRDDAASALVFLAAAPGIAPGIYNVADELPVSQREAYAILAEHSGLPLPPEGQADLARKRGVTSKRVSNAKLRALGWTPEYPSLRAALTDPGVRTERD